MSNHVLDLGSHFYHWLKTHWCIGKITSDFIWHMEDVLDLYEQPYDPSRPVICFDERPCQLIGDSIVPLPIEPGRTKKEHYEYIRNGTCCIFMAFEPIGHRLSPPLSSKAFAVYMGV